MPPTVAIIGASTDRSKYGNKSVRAHLQAGFTVYPVNPHAQEVEGLRAYARLEDVPGDLDRVSMYVPPKVGLSVLPAVASKKPKEFFLNPGSESEELVTEAERLGLSPIQACSIVAMGMDPSDMEEA